MGFSGGLFRFTAVFAVLGCTYAPFLLRGARASLLSTALTDFKAGSVSLYGTAPLVAPKVILTHEQLRARTSIQADLSDCRRLDTTVGDEIKGMSDSASPLWSPEGWGDQEKSIAKLKTELERAALALPPDPGTPTDSDLELALAAQLGLASTEEPSELTEPVRRVGDTRVSSASSTWQKGVALTAEQREAILVKKLWENGVEVERVPASAFNGAQDDGVL